VISRLSLRIDTSLIVLFVCTRDSCESNNSNLEAIFIKLDFKKAFDSVSLDFLFELLVGRGFGHHLIEWIKASLLSGTSSILVNGKSGNYIQCRRGLRQGDPLSPYLFILVADTLTRILSLVGGNGSNQKIDFFPWPYDLISQHYADDTLLLVSGDAKSLITLKLLLYSFEMMTRLKINFHKSCVYNFSRCEEMGMRAAFILNCNLGALPFTYLGLPIKVTSLTRED